MKLGEDATPKLTAATIEKAEITAFRQRDLLIECRDVLDKVALFGEYPDKLSIGHEAALRELGRNARALLAKLES